MTTPVICTPHAIIADALVDAGIIQLGDEPQGEMYASAMRRLRDIVNLEQTQGLKLWVNEDITVPLQSGVATYTFAPAGTIDMTKPLRVMEAYYLFTSTNTRRPLSTLSLNDYWTLGQAGTLATNQGTITQYLVEKKQAQLKVTFWLCPDDEEEDNGEVHLLMQTQITEISQLNETMNFPIEWRVFLHWALAEEMATGQPQAVIDRCASKAERSRIALEGWDVEDASTTMQVDSRAGAGGVSFR